MWYIVLVTLVACSNPIFENVKGPFENRKQCLSGISELEYHQGPPTPGSHYECLMLVLTGE